MRVITVTEECENNITWCRLENDKEVSRKLKIAMMDTKTTQIDLAKRTNQSQANLSKKGIYTHLCIDAVKSSLILDFKIILSSCSAAS